MTKRCSRRGSVMVEFALSFSLLFTVMTGVYRFGYALYIYNEIQSAVRSGASYAALRSYDATYPDTYATAVKNMVVYGNPNGGSSPIVNNLAVSNVSVSPNFRSGVLHDVTVSISGYRIASVFSDFTLNGKPKANFPYAGYYSS